MDENGSLFLAYINKSNVHVTPKIGETNHICGDFVKVMNWERYFERIVLDVVEDRLSYGTIFHKFYFPFKDVFDNVIQDAHSLFIIFNTMYYNGVKKVNTYETDQIHVILPRNSEIDVS